MLTPARRIGGGRMQLEFQCQKCEESFSSDVSDLSSDPTLRCPSCGAHAPGEQVEALVGAMEDLFAVITPVRRKFTLSVEINSEELPPPYDEAPAVARKAALLDEEESEDEDETEDEETAERDLDF
jgi:DNA-directed RNA polymerase subunit RPC12/RpoP